jgi:hypothetical protein
LWSRVIGFGLRRFNVIGGDLSRYAFQRRYWEHNSLFLDNVYNKISTDVASQLQFKHVQIIRHQDQADEFYWQEYSPLAVAVGFDPNPLETPTPFWSRVVRKAMKDSFAVVVPVPSSSGKITLWLASTATFEADLSGEVYARVICGPNDSLEYTLPIADVWVFENPKEDLSAQLNTMLGIIDDNLKAIQDKIAAGTSVRGLLKLPTRAATEELKRAHIARMESFTASARAGVSYLEAGEEFQELVNTYGMTASADEMGFLKQQLYNTFGLNEALFTADYSEQQFRAYFQSVIQVWVKIIGEEINRKAFTINSRSRGWRLLTYVDLITVASLKDVSDFLFRGVYAGNLNNNEARLMLGLGPYPGGDVYQTNKNAIPISATGGNNDQLPN